MTASPGGADRRTAAPLDGGPAQEPGTAPPHGLDCRTAAALLAICVLAWPASATTLRGEVAGRDDGSTYEVWLTTSLDLSAPDQPVSRATPDVTGAFELTAPPAAQGWVFLRQEVRREGAPPIVFLRPDDLRPRSLRYGGAPIRLRGLPSGLARLRAEERPLPGFWLPTLALALLVFGLGEGLRRLLAWRRQAAAGARDLLDALRGRESDRVSPGVPLLARHDAPPPAAWEWRGLLATLGLATLLRARRLLGPLDLLEWTYGPGSGRVVSDSPSLGAWLLEQLLRPPSVEVTHPPLYHWLMGLLGASSSAEWLLRLPALLLSLATLTAVWWTARRVTPRAGLLAAAAFAVAGPAVHFGADATPYALSGLCAAASPWLVLRALRLRTTGAWAAWLGLLVVGVLCHYSVGVVGLVQLLALATVFIRRARSPAWSLAAERAVTAGLWLAPLPLLWSLAHFAWFAPTTLDTRLFADVYPPDPGLLPFLGAFLSVSLALPPDAWWLAVPVLLVVVRGLSLALRHDRLVSLLLIALTGAWMGQVLFFHQNLVRYLDGRIFWGFRWVAWYLPVALTLAAIGVAGAPSRSREHPPAPGASAAFTGPAAAIIGAAWLALAVPWSVLWGAGTNRPAYDDVAAFLAMEAEDRDGVATLPLWGQRGPLTTHLAAAGATYGEAHGLEAWRLGDRALFLEALEEDLPFPTGASNHHLDRLWVLRVDESTFGRPKFSLDVADDLLTWADHNLQPDGRWRFGSIDLRRYRRPTHLRAWQPGVRVELTAPEVDVRSLPYNEPNGATCLAEEDGATPHWRLALRTPLAGSATPAVRTRAGTVTSLERRNGHLELTVEGGPCSGPAPTVLLGPDAA